MFKSRKLKSVSNAIKTVGVTDLSSGVSSKYFKQHELTKYGISGKPLAIAYDPVQSLIAVSSSTGEIHVYGQKQVEVVFTLTANAAVETLKFVKGIYLVAVDTKGSILIFSLYSKQVLSSYSPPGKTTFVETDPSLDWLLVGLANGSILAYDINRGRLTPFRIDNLQKQVIPKAPLSPVLSIQWNPRDIGTILVTYSHVAIIYSITTAEIKQTFQYEIPPNAPGGDGLSSPDPRYPRLIESLYHPNSLHAVTVHEDGSLVFWDAITGKLLQARTILDSDVNLPKSSSSGASGKIVKVEWITHKDPDDTTLVVLSNDNLKSLALISFGVAPKYSLTSYEKMSKHYADPTQIKFLAIDSPDAHIYKFTFIDTDSPYFNGSHNPKLILSILNNGDIEVMGLNGQFYNHLLPNNLNWLNSKIVYLSAIPAPKKQWLGIISKPTSFNLLKGGIPTNKKLKNDEIRTVVITGHSNGIIRLSDASRYEIDEAIDIDVSRILGKRIEIAQVSFATDTGELTVSLGNGDVVLFKFEVNRIRPLDERLSNLNLSSPIVDLRSRTPKEIKEGFLPISLIPTHSRRTTSITNSSIGFVAIGYENGDVIIVDRRGPAIIYKDNIVNYSTNGLSSYLTSVEFSILNYGDDGYSSILLFGGSNTGELYTFKILPETKGRFKGALIDVVPTNDSAIKKIIAYKSENGLPEFTNFDKFRALSDGLIINASLILIGEKDIRIFHPGKSKSSHKVYSQSVLNAGISIVPLINQSKGASVLTTIVGNNIKVLSLPELKEISNIPLTINIDPRYGFSSSALPNGNVIVRNEETEATLYSILGGSQETQNTDLDKLYNDKFAVPYRPTVPTTQWLKGTSIAITYTDLDLLIGGDRRPASRNIESEILDKTFQIEQEPKDEFAYDAPSRKRTSGGYDPTRYVFRQFQNGVDSVEESFNEVANKASANINESIGDAKNELMKGFIKSKFGF